MSCDICGKVGVPLQDIRKEYQTDSIAQCCSGCADIINPKRDSIYMMALKMHSVLFKEFITELKAKFLRSSK